MKRRPVYLLARMQFLQHTYTKNNFTEVYTQSRNLETYNCRPPTQPIGVRVQRTPLMQSSGIQTIFRGNHGVPAKRISCTMQTVIIMVIIINIFIFLPTSMHNQSSVYLQCISPNIKFCFLTNVSLYDIFTQKSVFKVLFNFCT